MRNFARLAGLVWILAALLGGIMLMGTGFMHGRSMPIYLAFGAALPGIMLYRWGRGLAEVVPARSARILRSAPIVTIDTDHQLRLEQIPEGPEQPWAAPAVEITPQNPCESPPRS
jgi:hypothetical protein